MREENGIMSTLSIGARVRVLLAALLTAGLLLGMLGLSAQRAHAALYFPYNNGSYIVHAGNNGLGGAPTVETGGRATGVAINGPYLYWLDDSYSGEGSLRRSTIAGTEVTTLLSGLKSPEALAIGGEYIYYGESGTTNTIGRVKLNGEDQKNSFITTFVKTPAGLAVNASHLYWTNAYIVGEKEEKKGYIASANISGSEAATEIKELIPTATSGGSPRGLAAGSSYLYWSSGEYGNDKIGRATLEGKEPEPKFIENASYVYGTFALGLDSTATHLYWSDYISQPEFGFKRNYGRAKLNGSAPPSGLTGEVFTEPSFFRLGVQEGAWGIASNTLRGTKITVTCNSASPRVGRAMTCTAADEDVEEGTASVPTGPVKFSSEDPAATFGEGGPSCTLASTGTKTSSCSVTYVPGTVTSKEEETYKEYRRILAASSNDSVHASGYGTWEAKIAAAHTSTTTLACAPTSLPAGASSNCTATVTDTAASGASEPTGTVSFTSTNSAGTFGKASCTLTGNGNGKSSSCAPVSYSQKETGTPELTASFAGGGGAAASQGHATLTFTQRTTAVSVICAPSPRGVNLETSCTASVSDNSAEGTAVVPTGTVSFLSSDTKGSFEAGSCTLVKANGTSSSCAVNYTQPDLGEPTIKASYAGDALHTGATATTTVDFTTSTTTLVCAPESLPAGASSSCTATVTDVAASGASEPTGTVSFTSTNSAGTFGKASCTLTGNGDGTSSSCAPVSYSQKETGTPELTASFAGGGAFAASQGHATLTFTQRTTAVTVSCAPSPRGVNLETSCTASVSDNSEGTKVVPTGTVSFVSSDTNGSFEAGSCTLVSEGNGTSSSCAVNYTQPDLGEPTIKASYAGDASHTGATATTTVDFTTSTTTLVCAPESLPAGASSSCTATVTDTAASGVSEPTGTVSFTSTNSAGTFGKASCTLTGNGNGKSSSCAPVSYSQKETGTPELTASFAGGGAFAASQGHATLTFTQRTTAVSVICAPSPRGVNLETSCTASVSDNSAGTKVVPTGTVSFLSSDTNGSFEAGSCTLVSKGNGTSSSCAVNYTQPDLGEPTIKASYAGDALHTGATATTTVDFTKSTTTLVCAPKSLPAGASSNCTATVIDIAASGASEPTGTVSFTSTNSAGTFSEASCTLTPNGDGTSSSCAPVSYSQNTTGTPELTASFAGGGGGGFAASKGHATLTFTQRTTAVSLSCAPSPRAVNLSTSCTAIVSDNSEGTKVVPTGTVSFVSSDAEGSFEDASCTLVSKGNGTSSSCAVNYTQPDVGEPTIEASYAGDASHTGATATTTVDFTKRATSTTVNCEPSPLALEAGSSTCTSTVTDVGLGGMPNVPTGTVEFTSKNVNGTFSASTCELVSDATGSSSSCAVEYSQSKAGSAGITGTYSGDAHESPSSGVSSVTFEKRSTTTELTCTPSEPPLDTPTTCTITVKDTSSGTTSAPAGSISFILNGDGTVSSPTCTLVAASASSSSCSVEYTPTHQENPEIIAEYTPSAGNDHEKSEGSYVLHPGPPLTSTTVACAPESLPAGASSSCTATVTDTAASGASEPTGTVSFTSTNSAGTFSKASCTLTPNGNGKSSSCAPVSYSQNTTGTPELTASFAGAAGFAASEGHATLTFTQRTTAVSLSCAPSSRALNLPTSCTAKVSDDSAGTKVVPTGTVSFVSSDTKGSFEGGSSCTLVSEGNGTSSSCAVNYTQPDLGEPTIKASYAGDASHTGATATTTVDFTTSATTLVCAPESLLAGTSSNCTATVTDVATSGVSEPTGTVSFTSTNSAGTFSKASCTLTGNGDGTSSSCAPVSYSQKETGTPELTASFAGGGGFAAGRGHATLTFTQRTTAVSVSCAPSPRGVNLATSCTAIVSDDSAGTAVVPTGTVSFVSSDTEGSFEGGSSCTLVSEGNGTSSSCAVNYTQPDLGEPTIEASYAGDASHTGATATTTVDFTTSATTLVCAPESLPAGASSNCTATVTDTAASGASEPTGTVSFTSTNSAGTFSKASCTLTPNGDGTSSSCAPVSYSQSEAGTPELTASFAGGGGFAASEGHATLTFTQRTTAVSVSCAPSPSAVNLSTSCTAIVSDDSAGTAVVPTGTVSFVSNDAEGSFEDASCTLVSEGNGTSSSCAVNYTQPDVGEPTIEASYAGDALHTGATATTTVDFTKRATSTTVNCEPSPLALEAGSSTCTSTVTDVESGGTPNVPTGTVEFTSENTGGTFSASTCSLVSDGTGSSSSCSVEYTQSEAGSPTITGTYSGDAHESPSSGGSSVTFEKRSTTTELTCTPGSLAAGTATSCTATVTDNHADPHPPTGTVSFTASGSGKFQPGSCSLNPSGAATSSCKVSYTPATAGGQKISASYVGSPASDASSGDTSISVSGPHSTSTAVSCTPSSLQVGAQTTCVATVTDTGANAVSPSGVVSVSASDGGAVSPSSCTLTPSGGAAATCSVTYTPKAAGSPTVTATLQASDVDSSSSGTTVLTVSALPVVQPPSNVFTFGKVVLNKRRGTATIEIFLPDAGKLVLSGAGVKSVSKSVHGKTKVTLTLRLSGKAAKQLKRSHRRKIEITVKFTPTGGVTRTAHKTVTLVLNAKKTKKKGT
jgi:hypothetical protein